MRKLASLAFVAVTVHGSFAHAQRPTTLTMTCPQAAATVASAGAIVLSTGQFTYDRFVAHTGFCPHDQIARPAVAPTIDSPYCSLGYRCEYRMRRLDNN